MTLSCNENSRFQRDLLEALKARNQDLDGVDEMTVRQLASLDPASFTEQYYHRFNKVPPLLSSNRHKALI